MVRDRTALILYQRLPLEDKIQIALNRIVEWLEVYPLSYVSFSGGKDSTVLLDLVHKVDSTIPAVFADTGLESPSVRAFALERSDIVLKPKMRFDEVLIKRGYPVISKEVAKAVESARNGQNWALNRLEGKNSRGEAYGLYEKYIKFRYLLDAPFRISPYCCTPMKKQPFHEYERSTGRVAFTGMMAEEGWQRQSAWIKTGCNAFDAKRKTSKPLSVWTTNDVLHYLVREQLSYASAYGDIVDKCGQTVWPAWERAFPELRLHTTGCKRTGCQFCMFGAHIEPSPNRFEVMRHTEPRRYEYCIGGGEFDSDGMWIPNRSGLGLGFVLDYLHIRY